MEKLGQTIEQLEEVILSSGATANAARDFQRQISELQVLYTNPVVSFLSFFLLLESHFHLRHTHVLNRFNFG